MTSEHMTRVPVQFVLLLFLAIVAGCGYPDVGPGAFELAKALYTVCDMQEKEQLDNFRSRMNAEYEAGAISSAERDVLKDIVATAEAGEWEEAEREARQLLLDQNGRDVKFTDHGSGASHH